MTTATEKMIQAIEYVVKPIGIGANLGLLHLLWAMVSGAFLSSRGAVYTALKMSGRTDEETRRAGNILRTGQWQISELIQRWRRWVVQNGDWKKRTHDGWYAVSCDAIVFPRLKLQGWLAKMYRGVFGKAVPAVGFGVIVEIGHYEGERVPLLLKIVRCQNSKQSESQLKQDLLKSSAKLLQERGVLVHDAGASIKDAQNSGAERFVIRLATNCVARWPYLPDNPHGNRKYGKVIRPLERKSRGVAIPATNDATTITLFEYQGRSIEAHHWQGVVGDKVNVVTEADLYDIWVFLTRCIKSHWCLAQIWMLQLKSFFSCTWTDGLLSKYLWQQNRLSACTVILFPTLRVAGDYLNLDFSQAIC